MKSQDPTHETSQSNKPKDYDLLVAEAYERIQRRKKKKKQDEQRLAKRLLRDPKITERQFESALLTLRRRAMNRMVVEKAYDRLSAKAKRRVRYSMLGFYLSLDDYPTARGFLPKRFNGPDGFMESGYAWDIWSKLDDKESLKKHWRALTARSLFARWPFERSFRLADLGNYFLRSGDWRQAAEICREIPVELINALQADLGPMLAQCGGLLAACEAARNHLAQCKSPQAPDIKFPMLGDLTWRHDDIERGLNSLQRVLRRRLGMKRLKKLGDLDDR